MKKLSLLILVIVACASTASAQSYKLTFLPQKAKSETYYLAQHFRDKFNLLDSTKIVNNQINFSGNRNLAIGVYTLLDGSKKKMFDFMVDDSRKFSIAFDTAYSNAAMVVKGSKANEVMFEYMAKLDDARARAKTIGTLRKVNPDEATTEMKNLDEEMANYMKNYEKANARYRFTQLVKMFENVNVPETIPAGCKDTSLVEFQARFYRTHYWDNIDFHDHNLIYTPQMFDKMNYYFFGLLYYQDCDTITRYADLLLHRVEQDSTWMRYILEFITPKYENATKMVGWDQVFVNLTVNYYLQGKCPWATDAEVYSKRQTVQYLTPSLIGAMGQELMMADTNQSSNPDDWISSHYFPQRYVILWFWDPDCHHCQAQSDELMKLYDSLAVAGNKRFEVYAVGYESDVNKWLKYLRQHKFPFVNVGGANVNIDYQAAYNIHSAPTMIILDPDRRIIMNKTLPTSAILPFLDNYEKQHPEMATKVTHWMQVQKNVDKR